MKPSYVCNIYDTVSPYPLNASCLINNVRGSWK